MDRSLVTPALLLAAAIPGCASVASETSAGSGAAVSNTELSKGFMKILTLATVPEEGTSVLGLPSWRPFAARPQAPYTPLFGDDQLLALVDADARDARDMSALDVAVEDTGAGRVPRFARSADGGWLAFQRSAEQGAPLFVLEDGDDPSSAWSIDGASSFSWLGDHVLIAKDATGVRLIDAEAREVRAAIELASDGPGDVPEVVATASGELLLAFTTSEAKLLRLEDGTATPVADWNVVPALASGAAARTATQRPTVLASPKGSGFAIVGESADEAHRSVRFLDRDGELSLLHPAARADVAFDRSGALAYVRPDDPTDSSAYGPENASVVIHRSGVPDVVLDGATGFEQGLRFSADGEKIAVSQGRFLGRTSASGRLQLLDLGDVTNGVGQVIYTPAFDRAFVQLFKRGTEEGPSPRDGRLVDLDLESGTPTPVLAVKALPREDAANFFWMAVEPKTPKPVLYLRMIGVRRLVTSGGKVLCMLPVATEEIGWSNGVFYYVQEQRGEGTPHFQLRGISRDCKVDMRIGGPADEMLVETTPDRSDGYRDRGLLRVVFREGRDVFAFTPTPYHAGTAAPAGDDRDEAAPPADAPMAGGEASAPTEPTPVEVSVPGTRAPESTAASAGGCTASPARVTPLRALALAALAIGAVFRRRRPRE